ncbi:resolvase [Gloeobacter morelensis]|uniref:Resolvase n=1 Tax=Gloeobacter morelensis MG652769 TaxID=2781736 RepID=A0ABY3PLD8_9CYAN|nr:resolvase [Gloeobacter morelensis]UFP94517.1 resolvase [Gloeobacter morelensis MG652769]
MILGIDPGRSKCGLALVGLDRKLYFRSVVASDQLLQQVERLLEEFSVAALVIGDQTTSEYWQAQLRAAFPEVRLVAVPERRSSEQARSRYWQFNPPRGLNRLLPQDFRVPPEAYDDVVALILVERYLAGLVDVDRR